MASNKGVLILGATSSIAKAIAHEFAKKGYDIFLASRDEAELFRFAKDLELRYRISTYSKTFDVEATDTHVSFFQHVLSIMPHFEGVIVSIGNNENHSQAVLDFKKTEKILRINFTGICSILTLCANELEKKQKGFIIALSSISGDRGKKSDYIFGSAKAGLNTYLEGLRNRLASSHVQVLTVKLASVDTAATFGSPPSLLLTPPSQVGKEVMKAFEKSKTEIYIPKFWRYFMGFTRLVPSKVFKKLDT